MVTLCVTPRLEAHMYERQIEMVTTALAEESSAGALHNWAPEINTNGFIRSHLLVL
jgi:hypothetical protein